MERHELIKKIEERPQDRLAEVGDFVESVSSRDEEINPSGLHQALSDYAIRHAGSGADLDEEMEAVSVEEAIEELALSRAIEEGLSTPTAKRDDVMAILNT
jgi:hypothetical protein